MNVILFSDNIQGLNIVCENYARIYWVQSITQLEVSGNQQLW